MKKVSIIMLTHNAPMYTKVSIDTVRKLTNDVSYELIVLDNKSKLPTKALVALYKLLGRIDKLTLLPYNSLFAKGNNIASKKVANDSDYILLLNSDIEIKSSDWLSNMIEKHKKGITAYGIVDDPLRVDGYCYLIDRDLYEKYPLDESHQWWWAITKQQATVLTAGYSVQGYREHEEYIHHFGGKSGTDYTGAKGMDVTREQVYGWFDGKSPVELQNGKELNND